MIECETVIIGAGVIGSALARAHTKRRKTSCAVLEKEEAPAQHSSGRNSGVIHSGFNPKPGTLKAQLCVRGNQTLKEFCLEKNIPMEEVGTLVVALSKTETGILEELLRRGQANQVPELRIIDSKELRQREPNCVGISALYSPSGAITSGKLVTQALANDAQAKGAQFFFNNQVQALEPKGEKIKVITSKNVFLCEQLINCAGLYADHIAHMMGLGLNYAIIPFRGEYFKTIGPKKSVVNSMIYPVPDLEYPFLGVHWTKTIDGDSIIGPNATLALSRESPSIFEFNFRELCSTLTRKQFWKLWASESFRKMAWGQIKISLSKKKFIREAKKLIPNIDEDDVVRAKSGNRPQLVSEEGTLIDDMLIQRSGPSLHVLNAISPGFTCSLSFADYLMDQMERG